MNTDGGGAVEFWTLDTLTNRGRTESPQDSGQMADSPKRFAEIVPAGTRLLLTYPFGLRLAALDQSGAVAWTRAFPEQYRDLVVRGDCIWVFGLDASITAIETASGRVIATQRLFPGEIDSVLECGTDVYVVSTDKWVYKIGHSE
jgi:hypothetical protein